MDPVGDAARLAALAAYDILDTPPEEGFDDVVHLAAQLCGTPIALVSLVGADRQWFKARIGFPRSETGLDASVCAHALAAPDVFTIPDLAEDPRTRANPLVTGEPHIRFYAGLPLRTEDGVLGTLCVIDTVARPAALTDAQADALRRLARQVVSLLEARRTLKRSEHALARLRESEALFRTFAQAVPGHVWSASATGQIEWANEATHAYAGDSAERTVGDAWMARVHPEDQPRVRARWAASLASGDVYEIEFRVRRADGAYRWFLVRALPVRGPDGALLRWIGANTDIDEQRILSEELARMNATLERRVEERTLERDRLWRLSTDVMLVADFEGRIEAVNPAWTALLGWDATDLAGRSVMSLVHPDDVAATLAEMAALAAGVTTLRFENRNRHRDGSYRWLAWTAVPDDRSVHAVGRDMQAEKESAETLRRIEEALRQSQKMEAVGQLTGGLAHDFNNLLTGISGSLDLLQKRLAQGRVNDVDRYVIAAQGASKRAAALTHRLLAFSRRQTLDPKPTDVARLINGMTELIRRTAGPGIAVEAVDAPDLWTALVDPNQLENALLNLCINARDAMPDGGCLTVETGNRWMDERAGREHGVPPGQYLSICVGDTGTGMAPDVRERAFEPFFTTKPLGQGTGLGLSMIYGFARQSGGQVGITSAVGEGTTVCIYLPRHYGASEAWDERDAREAVLSPAAMGETVLIVDDEATVRMLVVDVLSDLGYGALEAEDGPSGLAILRSAARVDLLVTDVGLPGGMNGRQVADAARVLRPGLKVLFITGYAETAAVGNGHLDPGMAVMTKPFAMDDLAGKIRTLIAS